MSASHIDVNNQAVSAALKRIAAAGRDPDPVLKAIGEDLLVMVKRTFEASSSPDGTPWAPNSDATLRALLHGRAGSFKKSRKDGRGGGLTAKGEKRLMGKKPLIGETHALATTIFYNVSSGVLEIGTPMEYGAMQHFGGKKANFPNLWGDIPARPFMPITPGEELMPVAEQVVVDAVQEYLLAAFEG